MLLPLLSFQRVFELSLAFIDSWPFAVGCAEVRDGLLLSKLLLPLHQLLSQQGQVAALWTMLACSWGRACQAVLQRQLAGWSRNPSLAAGHLMAAEAGERAPASPASRAQPLRSEPRPSDG